jgi:hypothetical protein
MLCAFAIGVLSLLACNHEEKSAQAEATSSSSMAAANQGEIPYHQGCLNAIETCEVGHAETKVEGDVLKVWFVGGGSDTAKAVRVPEKEIALEVNTGDTTSTLVLAAKPSALAQETIGNCSYFEARAPWLANLKEFTATGTVAFKGRNRKIVIEYPKGYDPD